MIEGAVRAAQARPTPQGQGNAQGATHTLRSDLMPPEARAMLLAAADVISNASRGGIGTQLDALLVTAPPTSPPPTPTPLAPQQTKPPAPPAARVFQHNWRLCARGARICHAYAKRRNHTCAFDQCHRQPNLWLWRFRRRFGGGLVATSRENQLTPWSNDPVTDPSGEAFYLHDLDTHHTWTPTALPIRTKGQYLCRHGFGYTMFEHTAHDIAAEMLQFVPLKGSVKVTRLRLRNLSNRPRRLSVTGYAEWVLGTSRNATAGKILTQVDAETGAVLAHNPRAVAFAGRVAFADFGAGVDSVSCDRAEVLGRDGQMRAPAAVTSGAPLSGRHGPALDACAALQRQVVLAAGQTVDLHFLVGQAATAQNAVALIKATRARSTDAMMTDVAQHWNGLLTEVQVRSPDRAMDILLNGWLLYQTLSCRIWARAGFYQASGAYGFRDQLQDGMAVTALRPELTRAHLLRAASRQFVQGDVQHWWLPHSGAGVRTRISDDHVWLAYADAAAAAIERNA